MQSRPRPEPRRRVAAVILAAGAATRFGSPKQIARVGDRTMLEAVVDLAATAELEPIIVVVPSRLAVPPRAVPVVNDAPHAGLSRSLRLGIAAVPVEVEAAMILLADQPTMPPTTIAALLHAMRGDRPLIAAHADGRFGPPVLLRREAFDLAKDATGDEGLRTILSRHPDLVTPVAVAGHPPDIDTPRDLERVARPP